MCPCGEGRRQSTEPEALCTYRTCCCVVAASRHALTGFFGDTSFGITSGCCGASSLNQGCVSHRGSSLESSWLLRVNQKNPRSKFHATEEIVSFQPDSLQQALFMFVFVVADVALRNL
ncbi:hypothetical protein E2C01_096665 [Portunus trituberculatus]|uniref:Uncharacterized protein n=1 Tax=Portunus trituberculatus TaxID=210409 RepID=A0A5B7K7F5_PORTR|nr:hypothetical protein [Portunus trituberculatus]